MQPMDDAGSRRHVDIAPDMREMIAVFADDLSEQVRDIEEAMRASDISRLTRLVSQVRNASARSGFSGIGEAAKDATDAIEEMSSMDTVAERVRALLAVCFNACSSRDAD